MPENLRMKNAMVAAVVLAAMLVSGCAGIKRAWNAFLTPARAGAEAPLPQPDPWVPLGSPEVRSSAPVWPTALYSGYSDYSGGGQGDGLATLIRELDHIARLVDTISRMPAEPGEFRVNYVRIQADLAAVRAGLVEALLQPHAAPRDFPPIQRDYLE